MSQCSTQKFLPYSMQYIDNDDIQSVVSVLQSSYLTNGPLVKQFQNNLSELCSSKFCVVSSSGTTALHLAVKALCINKGDYVIVPAITFVASANAVKYEGGEVVFADVDPSNGLMTPKTLQACIDRVDNHNKIKAIINVHMGGNCSDLQEIYNIARRYKLKIIDDASHALGSEYQVDNDIYSIGSCAHCDITTFSFHPLKNITTGEGGAITTNDKEIYKRILRLKNHGITKEQSSIVNQRGVDVSGIIYPWYYEMDTLGYNYRLSDINCALGVSQLKKIVFFREQKQFLKNMYDENFSQIDWVTPVAATPFAKPLWHLYIVLIDFQYWGIRREDLMDFCLKHNIGTQVHYIPLYYHPYYNQNAYHEGCEKYYENCISLPLHPGMSDVDIEYVINTLNKFMYAHETKTK